MEKKSNAMPLAEGGHGTLKSYVLGFTYSILLTLVAYGLVEGNILSNGSLIAAIILLAIVQVLIQLLFFMHLGEESSPRWNLLAFIFMLLVVVIVVAGSLWIMHNLNERMMPNMDGHQAMASS